MLTATAVDTQRGAPAPTAVQVVVRRRQVLASLLAGALGCGLLAAAGFAAMWWAAILLVLLAAGYLTLVARLRHLRVQRRLDLAFGSDVRNDDFDWGALERELHLSLARDDHAAGVPGAGLGERAVSVEVGNRAIARFLAGWAIGWLLTPVVSLIRLVRGDLSILERHGLAHRIVRLQQYGRSQSLRLLTVGAAASVSLTAVGGLTAGPAGASPMVAAVSTTAAATGTPVSSTYTVVRGDTLSGIAERSGTSVNALASANHLANPNFLLPGEVLSVTGSSTAAPGSGAQYVVRAGDTLGGIAHSHGTTVAALASANGIANPNRIFPGQALTVPAATGAPAAASASTGAVSGPGSRYVVRAGDTVSAVARRYGTTVAALSAANHLANPNTIFPGQVLTLPTAAAPATPAPAPAASAPTPAKVGGPTPAAVAAPTPPPPPAPTAANAAQSALPLPSQYLQGGTVDQGVDYAAPGGTPLYAMGPGTIIRAGMDGFGPNCPVLQITAGPLAGKTVYYGHAGPNLVPVGATVAAGQQISIVGYGIVGYSTGPHLEVGFYPPGGDGAGQPMLDYLNHAVGHNTGA